MQGFLNLNKPTGWTSHDCVAKVRRLLRLKRVGHGGTLDPAATGVLPVALGKATKLLQYLPQDKAYRATIRFGVRTTTDDLEGEVVETQGASELSLEDVKPLLQQFEGTIRQVPPMYSAVQVKGKRLYELARAGKTAEIPDRVVEVYRLEVLDWHPGEYPELEVAIACGSGTYIRSIARDLGESLHKGGVLASLVRTQSSGFHLADSLTLAELETQLQQETFEPIAPEVPLHQLTAITLATDDARRWCLGQRLLWQDSLPESEKAVLRVREEGGNFLGIGQMIQSENEWLLAPKLVFATDFNPE